MKNQAAKPIRTPAEERRVDQAIANADALMRAWRMAKGRVIPFPVRSCR